MKEQEPFTEEDQWNTGAMPAFWFWCLMVIIAVAVFAFNVHASPAHKHRAWNTGKVSYCHFYHGHTLAARGINIGSIYEFKVGNRTSTGKVVDANGRKMKHWHRVFDLSPALFKQLFGGTGAGAGKLQYRLKKRGQGRLIPP